MKKNLLYMSGLILTALMLTAGFSVDASAQKKSDKMTAEELIAKHLDSIGTAEARSEVKTMMAIGTAKHIRRGRGGTGTADGVVVIASEMPKYMIGMKFNNPDYQFETMGYNGDNFDVGFVVPGQRSIFGDFLRTNESIFKRGVLGGTLSRSWELYNVNEDEVRVKYGGMEKVDGKKYHELKFEPKKGSDMNVSMFFDPDTFQHVRTEYRRLISGTIGRGGVDSSSGVSEKRYRIVEDFSNFKQEGRLTLPHNYKMYMEILAGNGTASYEWNLEFSRFDFNTELKDDDFRVNSQ